MTSRGISYFVNGCDVSDKCLQQKNYEFHKGKIYNFKLDHISYPILRNQIRTNKSRIINRKGKKFLRAIDVNLIKSDLAHRSGSK